MTPQRRLRFIVVKLTTVFISYLSALSRSFFLRLLLLLSRLGTNGSVMPTYLLSRKLFLIVQ
ncbi:hypothetical protein LINPERHAP2_LOCUS4593 [Linum perenne]